jgi:ABC transport system ATP-binding/permease protein
LTLLTLISAELAYGDFPLLDAADFSIVAGDRVGLIGRNGTGKSTLLNVLSGARKIDDGQLVFRDGLRVIMVEQEPVLPPAETLQDSLLLRAGDQFSEDERDRWTMLAKLSSMADQLGVDLYRSPAALSGGERKRAALALALALSPELLLLDEPTNHLDIEAIGKLESMLVKGPTLIVITHDRRFLDQVSNRIVELDRGVLRNYEGNYTTYERLKAEQRAFEATFNRKFDKFWAQEEIWIRKGVEARRTRNEGRVRRLEDLRKQRTERRDSLGTVRMSIDSSERSGKRVAELVDVGKTFVTAEGIEKTVIDNFSCLIQRGDRVGFIGPNGAGKTTLLKIILGQLAPDSGEVLLGTKLQTAYFDQMRDQLKPDATVAETISPGSDWIEINGQRKHVMSYLGDFLFSPKRAGSPIRSLSGGERNRLLLARLFAQPANLLVLDEPTNDLDMESLELLESTLQDYAGTLLLVSHDRTFLDNVVTQVIVSQGEGRWQMEVGGYSDWQQRQIALQKASIQSKTAVFSSAVSGGGGAITTLSANAAASVKLGQATKAKLSFKEQRELDAFPKEIEALEKEQQNLQAAMLQADYFRRPADEQRKHQLRLDEIEAALLEKLERWELLEGRLS